MKSQIKWLKQQDLGGIVTYIKQAIQQTQKKMYLYFFKIGFGNAKFISSNDEDKIHGFDCKKFQTGV
jgi:hypothetical protein